MAYIKKNTIVLTISSLFKQQLSHQLIAGQFIKIKLKQKPQLNNDWLWITKNKASKYAFPQFINQYLQEKRGSTKFILMLNNLKDSFLA